MLQERAAMPLTFHVTRDNKITVMRGSTVSGTIYSLNDASCWFVNVPGVLDVSTPMGARFFRSSDAAMAAILAADLLATGKKHNS